MSNLDRCFFGADVPAALHKLFNLKVVGNKVLDIGFGEGEIVAQFLEDGYQVLGIETRHELLENIETNLIEFGVSNTNLTVEFGDVEKFAFPKETFAAIICQNVLHFLEKNAALRTIDKMIEWLLPNGYLWLTVHHTDHIYNGKTTYFVSFFDELDIEPKFKGKATLIYKAKCWKPELDKSTGLCYLVRKNKQEQ